jgi:hypothetical protein
MKMQNQRWSSLRPRPEPRQLNSIILLFVGIAAVFIGSSGILFVMLDATLKGGWETLDAVALTINIVLLISGLQLLSWLLISD